MSYSEESVRLTEEVKEKALSSGADLVGIISTESIDAVPSHYRQWDDFYQNPAYTKKTADYMEGSMSVVVLGLQVFGCPTWDNGLGLPAGARASSSLNRPAARAVKYFVGLRQPYTKGKYISFIILIRGGALLSKEQKGKPMPKIKSGVPSILTQRLSKRKALADLEHLNNLI